ncbi:MAG: hypothetical protein V4726_23470, partial [Verrucomicrobiota bacterium]
LFPVVSLRSTTGYRLFSLGEKEELTPETVWRSYSLNTSCFPSGKRKGGWHGRPVGRGGFRAGHSYGWKPGNRAACKAAPPEDVSKPK